MRPWLHSCLKRTHRPLRGENPALSGVKWAGPEDTNRGTDMAEEIRETMHSCLDAYLDHQTEAAVAAELKAKG